MNENLASASTKIFREIDLVVIVEIAAIIITAVVLIIAMQRALNWLGQRLYGQRRLTLLALVPLLRLLIGVSAVILIVPLVIEPSLQNMVAVLGTVGIALGFALKDYASSLIAGVVAIGEKPYRNGDWVQIGDHYGEVIHVGMRTVELVTADDDRIAIPHNRLWNDAIVNSNDGKPRLLCVADFYLHPEHDADRVRSMLKDVALTSPYLHLDSPVTVIINERPWGTHYRLKAYPVDSGQQFRFVTDLTVRGKALLTRQGVRFAATAVIPDAGAAA
ncbi:mechanosensitive ion channel family protein [Guyparkeria hydrothermalis]|uniref:mechanosensitive ion channel family protein n=1 Tax=Guyparkeria hydrothermalis TaxID=923 RepID=UPI0020218572|nr:mechanosensitive ion channel domain-containing protein [Guyparkeria hydrothermalis]MCL7743576.1 mechanosensitive ion channel family protein [Guyparkeria hydrothermalis]